MLIAHVSDFHVFADRPETALVRPDAAKAAGKVAADIAALRPAVDAVIVTGDLTDGGSVRDYALAREILAPIRAPVHVVPGNHDRRAGMRAAFPELPFADETFLHYEARIGPLRLLALDTLVEGRVEGRLCAARLAWLEERLAADEEPVLIAMHHPPIPSGMRALDAMALVEGGEALGRMIAGRRGVRILCGHIHRPFHGIWNGAYVAVGGGSAFQVALDLAPREDEPPRVDDEPYAYFIHRRGADGGFAVHARYVRI